MRKYVDIDHLGIVYLREELPDMYHDFYQVARKALDIWEFNPLLDKDDVDGIKYILKQCEPSRGTPPIHTNRIYVTTECIYPALVMADIKPKVISLMLSNVRGWLSDDEVARGFVRGDSAIVLWVFEGDLLSACLPITASSFGDMLTAFYQDNLVNRDHLRLNWVESLAPGAARIHR